MEKYKCLNPKCGFQFESDLYKDIRCCPVCKYDQVEHVSDCADCADCADCGLPITNEGNDRCRCIGKAEVDDVD